VERFNRILRESITKKSGKCAKINKVFDIKDYVKRLVKDYNNVETGVTNAKPITVFMCVD
jgi:hypothetical protein